VDLNLHLQDWLNLLVRWTHLITGISWIGSSFYFMWLDSHLTVSETPDAAHKKDVEGELWMVHSGGFYQVERKKIGPGTMPKVLHWFKYEALFTWMSGMFLLGIVYYLTGGIYLIDPAVAPISFARAASIGIGSLVVTWFVYDLLWQTVGKRFEGIATTLTLALGGITAYGLCHALSGRAAFIHFGAILGTIMVANVWVRILPSQQKMIDATKEGRSPDFTLSGHAKKRSVHNSYMTFPVLFMMLSNHYPNAYAHSSNWIVLLLLVLLGASIRHAMIGKNGSGQWAAAPAVSVLLVLIFMTATPLTPPPDAHAKVEVARVTFHQVRQVIDQRCVSCHSTKPKDQSFGPSPGGVIFAANERIRDLAARIKERAVDTKTMPLGNKTGMTDDERKLLGRWIEEGATLE